MDKRILIYGGIGAVVLVGGFFVLNRGGGQSDAPAQDNGYYPATVYSSGGGGIVGDSSGSSSGDGTAASMDTSISALIASTLAQGQLQKDMTIYQADTDKAIAFKGYETTQFVTQSNNDASIQRSLADQLSGIVKTFQGSGSSTTTSGSSKSGFFGIGGGSSNSVNSSSYVTGVNGVKGTIGYQNGVISLDIAQLANKAA